MHLSDKLSTINRNNMYSPCLNYIHCDKHDKNKDMD